MSLQGSEIQETPRERFRKGMRVGIPYAVAGLLLAISFGGPARIAGVE